MNPFIETISFASIFAALYFEVFLLISLFESKKAKTAPEKKYDTEYTPGVTVIVPCFNEEATVAKTLDSLLALDYPKENLHILVVNDGSTDGTKSALQKYENDSQIKIFEKENGGKYTALNFGISKSETEFVGCLDADSFVDKSALTYLVAKFVDPKVMAVTPSMIVHNPKGLLRKMQRAEYSYGNFMRKVYGKIGAVHITPGPFSFFRKEVFAKIGLYKHAYNTEDMEMAMRMQKHGLLIANAPEALVYTVGPESVRKLYKQRVRWVSGFISNLMDYREMVFSKKFGDLGLIVLPFSIIGILLSFIFVFLSLYQVISDIFNSLIKFSIVGFQMPNFKFDLFFTNTSVLSLLSLGMVATIIALVLYGDRTTNKKWKFSIDAAYFVFLYSFISPFWLVASIYNSLTSKVAPWR